MDDNWQHSQLCRCHARLCPPHERVAPSWHGSHALPPAASQHLVSRLATHLDIALSLAAGWQLATCLSLCRLLGV